MAGIGTSITGNNAATINSASTQAPTPKRSGLRFILLLISVTGVFGFGVIRLPAT